MVKGGSRRGRLIGAWFQRPTIVVTLPLTPRSAPSILAAQPPLHKEEDEQNEEELRGMFLRLLAIIALLVNN